MIDLQERNHCSPLPPKVSGCDRGSSDSNDTQRKLPHSRSGGGTDQKIRSECVPAAGGAGGAVTIFPPKEVLWSSPRVLARLLVAIPAYLSS